MREQKGEIIPYLFQYFLVMMGIQMFLLVHYNQYDNSFVLGSVCKLKCSRGMVFKLWHSHVTSLAALKGALLSCCICRETLAADSKLRFPLIRETSERALGQTREQQ